MKRLNQKSVLLGIVAIMLAVSSAAASAWTFKGDGAWREKDGTQGNNTHYKNLCWNECRRECLNATNCTGVEYVLNADGGTGCEVHTGKFDHLLKVNKDISVWLK